MVTTLAAGSRLGPYQVVGLVGAGGMGGSLPGARHSSGPPTGL
jgi:hypothetical protein